jgi:methyl-accepting chemotaxis protein
VCELQAIQLRHAGEKLTTAVDEIIDHLHAIAKKIAEMTLESVKMTGSAEDAGNSFLCNMEDRLSFILSALHEYGQANHELSDAMNSIAGAINDMSTFVNDIEKTGVAIKLIALNAIVKAAHIGEKGAALGVLADAIHHLSFETDLQTRVISDTFKSIEISAQQLGAGVDSQDGKLDSTADHMAVDLGVYKCTLGEVNERIVSQLAVMDNAGKDLQREIEVTTTGISVHHTVAGVSESVASELESMVAEWRLLANAVVDSGNEDRKVELLKALEDSYTMNSEREVHHSVTVSGTSESLECTHVPHMEGKDRDNAEEDKTEEEFGENVELF